MHRTGKVIAVAAFLLIGLITITCLQTSAQPSSSVPPGFNQALTAINQAEAAGATQGEIAPLVNLLNNALSLNQEALHSLNQSENGTSFLTQADQLIKSAQNQAISLTSVAAQRTQMNHVLSYIEGLFAAVIGTILYAFGISLYRKYRIKRTLQMRIRLK